MKRIAVLTSGGDAPGMNAAIRAVVRTGLDKGAEVIGVKEGFQGLTYGEFFPMGARDVGGIIQQGGTVLGSARCLEFKTPEGQLKAVRKINENGIEGVIVIGGNGSQTGAYELSKHNIPVVGISSTIDNDLYGFDITIGVDTALNIALEAIDRLKITASSHHRAFLVEVMGRNCGYLALTSAIAGGAELAVLPETETDPEKVGESIRVAYEKGKAHAIVIVAEGASYNAEKLNQYFKDHKESLGFDVRMVILGHVQRGGAPSAFDRILASRLGAAATSHLLGGESGVVVGLVNGKISALKHADIVGVPKQLDPGLIELARTLDR
jgi:6-phosphofructokinase 1